MKNMQTCYWRLYVGSHFLSVYAVPPSEQRMWVLSLICTSVMGFKAVQSSVCERKVRGESLQIIHAHSFLCIPANIKKDLKLLLCWKYVGVINVKKNINIKATCTYTDAFLNLMLNIYRNCNDKKIKFCVKCLVSIVTPCVCYKFELHQIILRA